MTIDHSSTPGGEQLTRHFTNECSAILPSPAFDLALDRLGNITAHELAQLAVDRLDQLRARTLDDRREPCAELLAQAGIGEKIEPLQNLHPDFLDHALPFATARRDRFISNNGRRLH